MMQPPGYVDESKPKHVCKLRKSIYGLTQAARCWNTAIHKYLLQNEYEKSNADSCLYSNSIKIEDGQAASVILAIYVDDILILSNNAALSNKEKELLSQRFEIVDQGEVHHILGMSIKRHRKNHILSIIQPNYLEGVLKRLNMLDCKPVSTPLEPGKKFQRLSEEEAIKVREYQITMGCLTYAAITTRADIAADVGILARFMSKPGKTHWEGIKRVLRYIKGTLSYGLLYTTSDEKVNLTGFSDADWEGDVDT